MITTHKQTTKQQRAPKAFLGKLGKQRNIKKVVVWLAFCSLATTISLCDKHK